MDRQNHSTPIESIMSTTMENLKDMIDVNVVVGDAVETGAGATIIPISRVSFGFVSGGGEYGTTQPKLPFAGGAGTGVSVNPVSYTHLDVYKRQLCAYWRPDFAPWPTRRPK